MIKFLLPLFIMIFSIILLYCIICITIRVSGIIRPKTSHEEDLDSKLLKLSEDEIKKRKTKAVAKKILDLQKENNEEDKKIIEQYFNDTQKSE